MERLNVIILRLHELSDPQTEVEKNTALTKALNNGDEDLKIVRTMLSLVKDLTYEDQKETLTRYQAHQTFCADQKAQEEAAKSVNHIESAESCPYCNKAGHLEAQCRKKAADLRNRAKAGAARRAEQQGKGQGERGGGGGGKGGSHYVRTQRDPGEKREWGDKSENDGFSGICFGCGAKGHRRVDCPKGSKDSKKRVTTWNGKRGDGNMITFNLQSDDSVMEVNLMIDEGDSTVFLDSCASDKLIIFMTDTAQRMCTRLETSVDQHIGLTGQNQTMAITAVGEVNDWSEILVVDTSRKNIVSGSALKARGYALDFGEPAVVYRLQDKEVILICNITNGMPWVSANALFALPDLGEFVPAQGVHETHAIENHHVPPIHTPI
jgi:hypothetical protein